MLLPVIVAELVETLAGILAGFSTVRQFTDDSAGPSQASTSAAERISNTAPRDSEFSDTVEIKGMDPPMDSERPEADRCVVAEIEEMRPRQECG